MSTEDHVVEAEIRDTERRGTTMAGKRGKRGPLKGPRIIDVGGLRLLSYQAAARAMDCSIQRLAKLRRQGDIKATIIHSRPYFAEDELRRYIERRMHRDRG